MRKRDRNEAMERGRPETRHRASKAASGHGSSASTTAVREVMVGDVVTIAPSASLVEAARTMESANVGMLPIVEDGRVRGVITDRDIVVRAVARSADAAATTVAECQTSEVVCAQPDWTTERAMQAMSEAQIGRLPVVDADNALVGVVTLSSLAFRAPDTQETLETAQDVSRRSARVS